MVRLKGTDQGPAGKWTDAATGEHGDLLDLIARSQICATLADTLDEARRFLSLPRPEPREPVTPAPQGSPEAARRLFAMSKPIRGTMLVSRRLAGLEAELGVRLFHRTTRTLSLTPEGEAFLPHATAPIEARDSAINCRPVVPVSWAC